MTPFETVSVSTGNGGQHLWFLYPNEFNIKSGAGVLGPGIDIRANYGYVIVPPSKTSEEYKFEQNPDETKLSDLPVWILESLNGRVNSSATNNKTSKRGDELSLIQQGERHQKLLTFAGQMHHAGMDKAEIETALVTMRDKRLAEGDHPVEDKEISEIVHWISSRPTDTPFTDLGNAERFII